jgi:MFS family permease
MWAQALVLFNVIGIPLSHTTYLEYHFTTLFPSASLVSLALVLSLQTLCIFATPLPIGYLYSTFGNRVAWMWKAVFALSIIIATASQFALYKAQSYVAILILQGPVLGIALGTCFTISTLVLATHYRNDVPLVSVQSGFAGFAGAVVYTVLARFSFQGATTTSSGALAHVYNGGVMGATLLAAFFLLVRLRFDGEKSWTERYKLHLCMPKGFLQDVRGEGMWFILGYLLVFMGVLVYPVYVVILLTQPPGLFFPDTATYAILAMLGVAAMSGSVAANVRALRKVGPVNTFAAASVLAGAICLAPVSYPRLCVVVPLAALYGLALGALLSLHMIVAATFLSKKVQGGWDDDMPARVAIIMALAGLSALEVSLGQRR